jgi:hypothetical protein
MMSLRRSVSGENTRRFRATQWAAALAVLGAVSGSCTDNGTVYSTTDYAYWDPYYNSYYYPSDLAYSGVYWADSWDYSTYYYSLHAAAAPATPQAGVGAAIRALARGESVCPGNVTVTPKMGAPACAAAGAAQVRNGVTIMFNACQLSGGGTVSGTFDVTSSRTASDTNCNASTVITLNHTTTITNLTYTSPRGVRVVIPKQVDMGGNTYNFGQPPATISIQSTGQAQVFDSSSNLRADLAVNGTRNYTFSAANKSYTVSGTVTAQDSVTGGNITLAGDGINHTQDCCRPTAGTLTITSTGGKAAGQHVLTFSPTCGSGTFDNNNITFPACY